MLAAASGRTDAIRSLLDRGADPNARDSANGQTAVMFAAALDRALVRDRSDRAVMRTPDTPP